MSKLKNHILVVKPQVVYNTANSAGYFDKTHHNGCCQRPIILIFLVFGNEMGHHDYLLGAVWVIMMISSLSNILIRCDYRM